MRWSRDCTRNASIQCRFIKTALEDVLKIAWCEINADGEIEVEGKVTQMLVDGKNSLRVIQS
jgi:hypothetical protein